MKKNILLGLILSCACAIGVINFTSTAKASGYSLAFESNGGTAYNTVETNGEQGVILPTPEKYGCEFLGWYDNPSFNGEALVEYFVPTGVNTVYAKWSTPVYPVISFETYGGTSYYDLQYTGITVSLPTPEKLDYTFLGWYDNAEFNGTALGETYVPTQSVTLHAKWEKVVYAEISFESNGGQVYLKTKSNSAGIKLPTPTKVGYTFGGWFTTSNFSGQAVSGVYKPTESGILYAKWNEAQSYSVTLNTMGGVSIDPIRANVGSTVTLPEASRYGYRFDGWYTTNTYATKVGDNVTVSANVTYYAKWTEVRYLYLYKNYGMEYERLEFAPSATVNISDLTTPANYVKRNVSCPFLRWVHEDGTTAVNFTITQHTALSAEYDLSNVPVLKHFVDNGNGTWSSDKAGKGIWIFQNTESNLGTYSVSINVSKGANGAPGVAFRMTHSGKDYAFEEGKTSYIAAVLGPNSGALEMSKVINGSWSRIAIVNFADTPSSWQTKFNNNSVLNFTLKVMSYADGFTIYIDDVLAYTYKDTDSILGDFKGTGWGIRNSTTDQVVTFSNFNSYSSDMVHYNYLTDNGNGSYTTTSSRTVAEFLDATSTVYTYSGTFAIVKGNGGGVGLAIRMEEGDVMYPYETAGTRYISAVYCPNNGALQISMVDGDGMVYENSGVAKFFQLRGVNCKGVTELSPVALADMPTSWQTKYNNAASGATITSTMTVKDYGNKIEIYIDGDLAFTVTDDILSHFTGTGLGIRTSSNGATISSLNYTPSV